MATRVECDSCGDIIAQETQDLYLSEALRLWTWEYCWTDSSKVKLELCSKCWKGLKHVVSIKYGNTKPELADRLERLVAAGEEKNGD